MSRKNRGRLSKRKSKNNADRKKDSLLSGNGMLFDIETEPIEVKCVPSDQLQLNESELKQEFSKSLTSIDPSQPLQATHFDFRKGEFVSVASQNELSVHFAMRSILCHTSELEAPQEESETMAATVTGTIEVEQKEQPAVASSAHGTTDLSTTHTHEITTENADGEMSGEMEDEKLTAVAAGDKKCRKQPLVKNQFNFSERASQTFNQPKRDREMMTEAAPQCVFSAQASTANIYDTYKQRLIQKKLKQSNEAPTQTSMLAATNNPTAAASSNDTDAHSKSEISLYDSRDAIFHSDGMYAAMTTMERVVNQNSDQSTYFEFKYYKDDDLRLDAPFLSHLWNFRLPQPHLHATHAQHGNKMVTSLCWNERYTDLFAVGYGSYDFHRQTEGVICVYTLKNVGYPERIINAESGVLSLHFHPNHPSLLCCGMYDGSVAVYDIRNRDDTPIYSSVNPESYHSDPVWDVRWHTDELGRPTNFYSISSDGTLLNWNMSKNELLSQKVMDVRMADMNSQTEAAAVATDNSSGGGADDEKQDTGTAESESVSVSVSSVAEEVSVLSVSLCSCFDFNPTLEHLLLIGSEDGSIAQCSRQSHTEGYVKKQYSGHSMNVYAVQWNSFHPKTFISASEDWSLKLWDADEQDPIISYDLGSAVNDLDWSPYSATVFAAVTSDRLHIFDLEQNKNEPICSERIIKKNATLTHVAFAPSHPLIICGDSRGVTHAVKLSPQLYKTKSKVLGYTDLDVSNEKARLEKILKVTGSKVFDIRLTQKH